MTTVAEGDRSAFHCDAMLYRKPGVSAYDAICTQRRAEGHLLYAARPPLRQSLRYVNARAIFQIPNGYMIGAGEALRGP